MTEVHHPADWCYLIVDRMKKLRGLTVDPHAFHSNSF